VRLLCDVEKSLLSLLRLGDLYLERQYDTDRRPMTVDEWKGFSLRNFVEWDSHGQRWKVSPGHAGAEDIFVQLSQGAVNDLRAYEAQANVPIAKSE
jgi:hypothetical protein